MNHDDVRDLAGRFQRFVIAAVIGVVGSLIITTLLPTRRHGFGYRTGFLVEGGSIGMMIAGAVGIALATYAALGVLARRFRGSMAVGAGHHEAITIDLARCTARYRMRR